MRTEKKELLRRLKYDMLILAVILAALVFTALLPGLGRGGQSGGEVVILRDGEETARYSLSGEETITVRAEDGGYNLLLISQGAVRVTDADCPDKLCVRQRKISRNGESIICLPHKLVIMIDSPEESGLDAVTN